MNILAIFAHPDDEAYGPGATLARYALTGHRVSLVTMTRGEAGSLGICKTLTPEEVAEMRTEELKCAVKALNLQYPKIYGLPDKGLQDYPLKEGAAIVLREIEAHKPDILLTFHDKGVSGHPDHIAVAHWCMEAVRSLESSPRLIYYGISKEMEKKIKEHRKAIPFETGEITHVIDASEYFSYKMKAIQCHASQLELWNFFQKIGASEEYFTRKEHFSQVWPGLNGKKIFDDLYEQD